MREYTFSRELLPTIKSALAAIGYQVETLLQHPIDAARLTMMFRDATIVALRERLQHPIAEITLFGPPAEDTLTMLDGLSRLMPALLPVSAKYDAPSSSRRAEKVIPDAAPR